MNEIDKKQIDLKKSILAGFEKAVYKDTPENRKAGRVGQKYTKDPVAESARGKGKKNYERATSQSKMGRDNPPEHRGKPKGLKNTPGTKAQANPPEGHAAFVKELKAVVKEYSAENSWNSRVSHYNDKTAKGYRTTIYGSLKGLVKIKKKIASNKKYHNVEMISGNSGNGIRFYSK